MITKTPTSWRKPAPTASRPFSQTPEGANVATQFCPIASLPLHDGTCLTAVQVAYETYGQLNEDASNAVLVFHALTGSQHAAGTNPAVAGVGALWTKECQRGWWDEFIGPGCAIDTEKFFVICANYLGGCYGSTGPRSINPRTGRPYGRDFPRITLADIVDSQIKLLDHLGIGQLHAVVGASLGGLLAVRLATRHPERVRTVIPCATGLRVPVLTRILNFEQIQAIEADPLFQGGNYDPATPPARGLALARLIAFKTYRSLAALAVQARPVVEHRGDESGWYEPDSPIESYLLNQGRKFVQRFDANTYLRLIDAWNRFDLAGDAAADRKPLFDCCRQQKWLVLTIDTDACFYPEEQGRLVTALKSSAVNTAWAKVRSDKGHDSFLTEPALYRPVLRKALKRCIGNRENGSSAFSLGRLGREGSRAKDQIPKAREIPITKLPKRLLGKLCGKTSRSDGMMLGITCRP